MRIDKIKLKNFKSHIDSEIEPKKITILIGPTNSGKSSILQSLLILKNTTQRRATTFETHSPTTYDYGSYEDVITQGDKNKTLGITIQGTKRCSKYFQTKEDYHTQFIYEVFAKRDHFNRVHLRVSIGNIGVDYTHSTSGKKPTYAWDSRDNVNLKILSEELNGPNPTIRVEALDDYSKQMFNSLFLNGTYTEKLLDEFYYVPFSRVVTAYRLSIEYSNEMISTNQEKTASALLSRISADPKLKRKISKYISKIGGKSIETRNIETRGEEQKKMTLDFVSGDFSNSIINEGSGLNQLILFLAVLVDAPEESIVAIEEPELHLDPTSQSKLMSILLEQVENEDKQIIFTTHSEHMVFPLLANISKKDRTITENDIAIYYFSLDDQSHSTKIEKLEINEHGQIKGGLKGFWDVDADAMSEILGEVDD